MLNAAIKNIPLPSRMARRPVSDRGFPVPWFVAKINGEWDFRAIAPGAMVDAYRKRLCWLCGEPLGRYVAFVIGPMCAINRVSSEPPSHRECAVYAVKACPFLSKPNMRRNEKDLPIGKDIAGIHLEHNPGVSLVWICRSYHPMKVVGGTLFEVGPPSETHFYREGRIATRAEVLDAIDKGLPYLREIASIEGGERELDQHIERAMKLVPVA
jgi:hypothetical protein